MFPALPSEIDKRYRGTIGSTIRWLVLTAITTVGAVDLAHDLSHLSLDVVRTTEGAHITPLVSAWLTNNPPRSGVDGAWTDHARWPEKTLLTFKQLEPIR